MSKNNYKQKNMAVPIEKHNTAAWANIEKKNPSQGFPFPVKFKWKTPRNMPIQIKNKNKSQGKHRPDTRLTKRAVAPIS